MQRKIVTKEIIAKEMAKLIDKLMWETLTGPQRKQPQTAIRLKGNIIETVELDDKGNIIEPPARCCYGVFLHDPKCKYWATVC